MNKGIVITIFFMIFYSLNGFAQNKKAIYIDDKEDYVLLLDKDVKTSSKNVDGTEIDIFAKTSNNAFNYTLLISKIFDHKFIDGNLMDEDYENYYLDNCGCTILEKELVYYNNLQTLRYKIKAIKGDNTFIGYNDSFVSDYGYLYNILFLSFESDFEDEEKKYSKIMNTLIINGETTIDGYNEINKN